MPLTVKQLKQALNAVQEDLEITAVAIGGDNIHYNVEMAFLGKDNEDDPVFVIAYDES